MKEIKEHFILLFDGLAVHSQIEITYSNKETKTIDQFNYNNFNILFHENHVTTIYKNNQSTERNHLALNEIVKEISEERFPLFSFSMF